MRESSAGRSSRFTSRNEQHVVRSPRMMMVGVREVIVGTPDWRDPDIAASHVRVPLEEITAIEDIDVDHL